MRANPTDACTAPLAPMQGQIAIVDRGICAYAVKAANVQDAGAVAMVLVNSQPGAARAARMIAELI